MQERQTVPTHLDTTLLKQNYFVLFGFQPAFDLDMAKLKQVYLSLQKKFHPDRFVNQNSIDRQLAIQIATYINDAYKTLKEDVSRAEYLIQTQTDELLSSTSVSTTPAFLMQQMELHEELDDIKSSKESKNLHTLRQRVWQHQQSCLAQLAEYLRHADYQAAQTKVAELQFYQRLLQQIDDLQFAWES